MASYAPMPYSLPMAYSAPVPYNPQVPYSPPMPYANSPPSYAPPSYDAPSSYEDYQSDSILLTPLVDPEDPSGGGGGGGGMMTKFLALPPIILLPILIPLVLVILKIGFGFSPVLGKKPVVPLPPPVNETYYETTPYYNENYETAPYYDESGYGNNYPDENNYNDMAPYDGNNQYRKRRQAEENKNISSSSSALPSMSIGQVERLTQVVYAAMNSQECIQRLLCEVGFLSRSFSDSTTRTVTKAVEDYVPEKLKDSYNIFAKAEKCERYKCGFLKVNN